MAPKTPPLRERGASSALGKSVHRFFMKNKTLEVDFLDVPGSYRFGPESSRQTRARHQYLDPAGMVPSVA